MNNNSLDYFGLTENKNETRHYEAKSYSDLYRMHKYWSKKPYNVISDLILKYSKAGNIVLDPFCGSGVTLMESLKENRKAFGIDINPSAVLISKQTIKGINIRKAREQFEELRRDLAESINTLYKLNRNGTSYTMTHCVWEGDLPIQVWYRRGNKLVKEKPTQSDIELAHAITYDNIPTFYPKELLFVNSRINVNEKKPVFELFTPRNLFAISMLRNRIQQIKDNDIREFFNFCLTSCMGQATKMVFAINGRGKFKGKERNSISPIDNNKYEVGSWVIGYWVPKKHFEINVWDIFERRTLRNIQAKQKQMAENSIGMEVKSFQELVNSPNWTFKMVNAPFQDVLKGLPKESIDYVLTDPPHGDREPYLELSMLWNSWLGVVPDYDKEIVISDSRDRKKDITEYLKGFEQMFGDVSRVLKVGNYFTIIFNSLEDKLWAFLINIGNKVGLMLSNIETMNYSANSVVQDTRKMGMTRDVVITFKKVGYDLDSSSIRLVVEQEEVQNVIRSVVQNENVKNINKFVLFADVNQFLMKHHSFILPSHFYKELEEIIKESKKNKSI